MVIPMSGSCRAFEWLVAADMAIVWVCAATVIPGCVGTAETKLAARNQTDISLLSKRVETLEKTMQGGTNRDTTITAGTGSRVIGGAWNLNFAGSGWPVAIAAICGIIVLGMHSVKLGRMLRATIVGVEEYAPGHGGGPKPKIAATAQQSGVADRLYRYVQATLKKRTASK